MLRIICGTEFVLVTGPRNNPTFVSKWATLAEAKSAFMVFGK